MYVGRLWVFGALPPITELGNDAFYDCGNLTDIYVPDYDSVTAYRNAAGWSTYAPIISTDFPVTSGLLYTQIGSGGSAYYTVAADPQAHLQGPVYIPATYNGLPVKEIANYGFQNCSEITEVKFEFGSTFTTVGNYAFSGCSDLVSFRIPDGVTSVGNYAF